MRILLAISVWIVFVGGLALYMNQRDTLQNQSPREFVSSQKKYHLEIVPTFDAEADPFALKTAPSTVNPILVVYLNGKPLLEKTEGILRGEALVIPDVVFEDARNEILVQASPPTGDFQKSQGIRVRVIEGLETVMDETFWGDGGLPITGTLLFDLTGEKETVNHAH